MTAREPQAAENLEEEPEILGLIDVEVSRTISTMRKTLNLDGRGKVAIRSKRAATRYLKPLLRLASNM